MMCGRRVLGETDYQQQNIVCGRSRVVRELYEFRLPE